VRDFEYLRGVRKRCINSLGVSEVFSLFFKESSGVQNFQNFVAAPGLRLYLGVC
jgi:hypothetical protein